MTEDANEVDSKYKKWKPCPECGNKTVRRDGLISIDRSGLLADVVCDTCGNKEDSSRMYADRTSPAQAWEENTPDRSSNLELTPKQKLWQNSGMLLVVLGILLSLTLVGAVIGIPMIIAGMLISSKGGPDMDEIEFSCPECGAELEHDTTVCPECGEDGLRLDKSRSLKE